MCVCAGCAFASQKHRVGPMRVQLRFPYLQAFISEAIVVEELSVTMFEEGLVGL